LLVLALVALARPALAQETPESDEEKNARLARRAAAVRVGVWRVTGLSAGSASAPVLEGYFQRGLDKHLAIESSAAVWRRTQTIERSGGPLGGSSADEISVYVVPLLTSLKFYPGPVAGDPVEPFLLGGVGFALGIGESAGSGGLFGGSSSTSMITGFGAKAGIGVELKLSPAFGVTGSGRYQWIRFGDNLGGDRTFRGLGFEGGVTYRFQY
jgi:hypothetical protein